MGQMKIFSDDLDQFIRKKWNKFEELLISKRDNFDGKIPSKRDLQVISYQIINSLKKLSEKNDEKKVFSIEPFLASLAHIQKSRQKPDSVHILHFSQIL